LEASFDENVDFEKENLNKSRLGAWLKVIFVHNLSSRHSYPYPVELHLSIYLTERNLATKSQKIKTLYTFNQNLFSTLAAVK